jgi:hypothetical protein
MSAVRDFYEFRQDLSRNYIVGTQLTWQDNRDVSPVAKNKKNEKS